MSSLEGLSNYLLCGSWVKVLFGDYRTPVLIGVVRQNKYSRPISGVILDLPGRMLEIKRFSHLAVSNTYSYKRPNFPVTLIFVFLG